MAQSAEDRAKAEAIVSTWVWQPADGHNYRFQYAVRTLTRFYEAASMQPDELKLVIEYLREQEIGTDGISLMCRNVDFGTGWKAKDAWYQTQTGNKFANTDSTRVRVYQVLFQAPAGASSGDGPYDVEKGCQYLVKHTFYWDVASVPTVPAATSGVEYRLQGVTRDRETGLFSAVLEQRTRVQQDVAEYVTAQTAFETKKNEQHIGVKQGDVATTGQAASVGAGTIVKRQLSKNADCTTNVENEVTVEKPVAGAVVEIRKTLNGTIRRTVSRNQAAALTDGTEAGGTPMVIGETRRSEKTEGELWNTEVQAPTNAPAGVVVSGVTKTGKVGETPVVSTASQVENVDTDTGTAPAPSVNKQVKRVARKNDQGTIDIETEETEYKEVTATSTTTYATETVVTTVKRHSTPTGNAIAATLGDASAEPDDNGAVTTRVSEVTPIAVDSGWVTWDSQTVTPAGTYKYHHGVRIFKNQNATWLQTAKPSGGSNVSVNANVNKSGLFDGSIAYTDLYAWDLSGSGTVSGIVNGTHTFYEFKTDAQGRRWRRQLTVSTICYYGRGNEGSEASTAANSISYPGLHLPSGVYATAAPVPSAWTTVGA